MELKQMNSVQKSKGVVVWLCGDTDDRRYNLARLLSKRIGEALHLYNEHFPKGKVKSAVRRGITVISSLKSPEDEDCVHIPVPVADDTRAANEIVGYLSENGYI